MQQAALRHRPGLRHAVLDKQKMIAGLLQLLLGGFGAGASTQATRARDRADRRDWPPAAPARSGRSRRHHDVHGQVPDAQGPPARPSFHPAPAAQLFAPRGRRPRPGAARSRPSPPRAAFFVPALVVVDRGQRPAAVPTGRPAATTLEDAVTSTKEEIDQSYSSRTTSSGSGSTSACTTLRGVRRRARTRGGAGEQGRILRDGRDDEGQDRPQSAAAGLELEYFVKRGWNPRTASRLQAQIEVHARGSWRRAVRLRSTSRRSPTTRRLLEMVDRRA